MWLWASLIFFFLINLFIFYCFVLFCLSLQYWRYSFWIYSWHIPNITFIYIHILNITCLSILPFFFFFFLCSLETLCLQPIQFYSQCLSLLGFSLLQHFYPCTNMTKYVAHIRWFHCYSCRCREALFRKGEKIQGWMKLKELWGLGYNNSLERRTYRREYIHILHSKICKKKKKVQTRLYPSHFPLPANGFSTPLSTKAFSICVLPVWWN